MEDYDFTEFSQDGDWGSRFPLDAVGSEELRGVPISPEGNLEAWRKVTQLRSAPRVITPCVPRILVSHRKPDREFARRVAWRATQEGFRFWLDVLDPTLLNLSHQNLAQHDQALVTATVIEMGLLNSSHALALVTPKSPGSLWVPDEYGREGCCILFKTGRLLESPEDVSVG